MTIAELLALKKAKIAEMKSLTDDNPETMDAETAAKFDALEEEVKKIDAQIERKKKVEGLGAEFEGAGRRTVPTVPARAKDHEEEARGGFENFAEFAMAVKAARAGTVDDRLKFLGAPSGTLHRESGSDDGFMVPTALKAEIFQVQTNDFNLLPLVDSEPTSSNAVKFLSDESTAWGSTGVQAYWTSEAGAMVRSKLATKGKLVELHKVHAFVEVTDELLEDAPMLNQRLTLGSNRAINWKLNQGIIEGDGIGKMLGFKNSPCAVAVARANANQVDVAALVTMYARSTNPAGSYWMISTSVLPQLMGLTVGNQPVWLPPTGIAGAPGGFLLGRPVQFSQHCGYLGTRGDVTLIDPKGYYMPNRGTVKASQSMHLLFDYDVMAFKWTFRAGGLPYLSAPVVQNKGTAPQKAASSLSSFIELGDPA